MPNRSGPEPAPLTPRLPAEPTESIEAAEPAGSPFIDDYLPALLAQASHLISHEFHVVVREQGLTVLQWRVLATLADGQTSSVGLVSQRTVTPQPTVSRVVDEMKALGLITRAPAPHDRRITLLTLTPDGRRRAARLVRLARAHEASVLAPVGKDGAAALKRALRQLVALRDRTVD